MTNDTNTQAITAVREAQDKFNKAWNTWTTHPDGNSEWVKLLDTKAVFNERVRNLTDSLASLSIEGGAEEQPLKVRPAVRWFAEQMEAKLRENDHKGGWIGHDGLLTRLREETDELYDAIVRHEAGVIAPNTHPDQVTREAADVANFAMMIADNYGPKIGHKQGPSRAEEGKLTDEEIERMVMADLTDDAHVGLGLTHEGALAIARTFEIRGMKMARDHYLATKEDPAA